MGIDWWITLIFDSHLCSNAAEMAVKYEGDCHVDQWQNMKKMKDVVLVKLFLGFHQHWDKSGQVSEISEGHSTNKFYSGNTSSITMLNIIFLMSTYDEYSAVPLGHVQKL